MLVKLREVVAACVFNQCLLSLNLVSVFLFLKEKLVSSSFSIIIGLFY